MYENIGKKLKTFAKFSCIIMSVLAVIGGIVLACMDDSTLVIGLVTALVSPFVFWISSWVLYAFGELVEKVVLIEINTRGASASKKAVKVNDEKIKKANALLSQGLITNEEYQSVLNDATKE